MDSKLNTHNLKAHSSSSPLQSLLPFKAICRAFGGDIPGQVVADLGTDDQCQHYIQFAPDADPDGNHQEGPAPIEQIEPIKPGDAALWYAVAYNWPVFPVHTPTGKPDQPCSCNRKRCKDFGQHPCHEQNCKRKKEAGHVCHKDVCTNIGKHPRTMNGKDDATTDPAKIRDWWKMWPKANVGVVTGKASGFFVVDVDPRNGGLKTLADIEREHKPETLPKTKTALTGGDGFHYLFKYPDRSIENSSGNPGPGIDIKRDGGYIVAAPSNHASGKQYAWRDGNPIVDAPAWLVDLLTKPKDRPQASSVNGHYQTWDGLRHEAGERIKAQPTAKQNKSGNWDCRGICHNGEGDTGLFYNPSTNQFYCNAKCDQGQILRALGLPEEPIGQSNSTKPSIDDQAKTNDIPQIEEIEKPLARWPAPLSDAAYYGLAGQIVKRTEPHTEADPAALLSQFLTMFGNVSGRSAHFKVEADSHYLNLNMVLVGGTSKGRKGTSQGHIKKQIGKLDAQWLASCVQSGLSSGEGLIWAVRDPIEGREPIKEKGRTVDYATVIIDEGVSDKRLLVYEPEYARTLAMASRDSNVLSAVIRQAWDDGNLSTMTKNSPARATGAHISIIGHITKDELLRLLDKTEAANGFGNRHLWVCVRRSKVLPEGGQLDKVDFSDLDQQLTKAFEFARTAGEMKRDDEARALWISRYEDLSDGKPGLLGAMTARAEAQVMRLACLYALLDCSETIRKPHLEAALEVWRYCEDSARFVFGDTMGDPVADSILTNLSEAGAGGMTRTQLNALFKGHATSSAISRALGMLAEIGKVGSRKEPTDGRPVEYWFITSTTCEKSEISEKRVLKAVAGVS